MGIKSGNLKEVTVSTLSISFDKTNWDVFQTVTLTGQDDFFDDGNQLTIIELTAAKSKDKDYNGLDPDDLRLYNIDNDFAGIKISAINQQK